MGKGAAPNILPPGLVPPLPPSPKLTVGVQSVEEQVDHHFSDGFEWGGRDLLVPIIQGLEPIVLIDKASADLRAGTTAGTQRTAHAGTGRYGDGGHMRNARSTREV